MPRPESSDKIVGIITKKGDALLLQSCSKKGKSPPYALNSLNSSGAKEGDVVVAEFLPTQSGSHQAQVKITRILGQKTSPGILSLISLYEQGLSDVFSQATMKQAQSLTVPDLQGREDVRGIPLVTVDGPDSRDFDDAIFAEDTADGGKHLIVAIADVSWYVRPGDAIDQDAYQRGNSTYFPDRAVPMLPEELSNGLCSLKPNEDRACMVAHLWIDKNGQLINKKIGRALMRSAARLTYEQLQAAKDGKPDSITAPLMDTVVNPLYAAYELLKKARKERGALDLSAPEYKVEVNAKGEPVKIAVADQSESHKVIEEFMVLANAAVDEMLQEKNAACIHRIHAAPFQSNKMGALREYLGTLGLTLPAGDITNSLAFKDVIEKARQMPEGPEIIKAIARAQTKAVYSTENIGHFGLALSHYAHFTSPIRRYADLLNHRSLVDAFNLGAGALDNTQKTQLDKMAEHINETEQLSIRAERSAGDRFAADYLSRNIGKEFKGRITGVIGAGVFVKLEGISSEGLLLARSLPKDYYNFDEKTRTLTGSNNGLVYKAGDEMTVRVKEANGLTASILLEPANDNKTPAAPGQNIKKAPHQQRHKNRGHKPQ